MRCTSYPLAAVLLVAWVIGWVAGPLPAQAQYFAFGKNKVQYEAHDWYVLPTEHFDVYYYEGGEELARFAAATAEDAYRQLGALFQHEASRRIPLILYQGHADFAATNAVDLPAHAEGIGGATELFKNRIAVPFTGSYRAFRDVLRHEIVHAVANDAFYGGSLQSIIRNNIQLRLPLWFSEGLAEYFAQGWGTEADMYVREAVLRDDLPPIAQLYGYRAYRGGQSVWDYVAEQYGEEKISEVLGRLRQTRSVEESVEAATGLSVEALSERWHRALREIYYPELTARTRIDAMATPLVTREEGRYHASPALSPQGDRVAYVTARGALFDVYVARTSDGKVLGKLIDGQAGTAFESLRLQTPGLSWSPDGERLAVAVKSGPSDAVAVVEVETREAVHYRIPDVDQILSVAWSPGGHRIALAAVLDAQSDILVLDLRTHEVINHTNDVFSDHAPAWSPDGEALVFHSDRGGHTRLRHAQADAFEMAEYDFGQLDLYRMPLGADRTERLTTSPWDDFNAQLGSDPDRLLFLSDRNGVYNLYEKNLTTGAERPLTDVAVGITQVALSADGRQAALVSLEGGAPSIYLLAAPFERRLEQLTLQPNVWAQRATETAVPAPALALASEEVRARNPFLRDAVHEAAPVQLRHAARRLLAAREPFGPGSDAARGLGSADSTGEAPTVAASGTTYGSVRVTFQGTPPPPGSSRADAAVPEEGAEAAEADVTYEPERYKLLFSPDLIYGAAGYDALYGVQGMVQMLFSDMMGNHQIFASTNLLVDLRNADYLLSYRYLPRRIDWSFTGYHTARLLPDYDVRRYYRYRRYGLSARARYPLDKFHRVDLDAGVVGASQADIGAPSEPSETRVFFQPAVTFTRDVTTPGVFNPSGGHRLAVGLSAGVGALPLVTVLGDARAYTALGIDRYTLAVRLSGGLSFGAARQLFYTAGVENWLNRRFDPVGRLPVSNVSDFVFATPVLPLRGHEINAQNGAHFGLLNVEARFPLGLSLLERGPLAVLPVEQLRGAAFLDVGGLWGGSNAAFNLFRRNAAGERVFDDLLVGTGLGVRALVMGYPVRLDMAWPYDGQRFGDRQLYLSVGFDF